MCRIEDPPVQQRHLAEKHLTFKKAAYVAFAMETAAKNAETLQRPTTNRNVGAHKSSLNNLQARGKGSLRNSPLLAVIVVVTHHTRPSNVRKEVKYHACGKVGRKAAKEAMNQKQTAVMWVEDALAQPVAE